MTVVTKRNKTEELEKLQAHTIKKPKQNKRKQNATTVHKQTKAKTRNENHKTKKKNSNKKGKKQKQQQTNRQFSQPHQYLAQCIQERRVGVC